MTSQGSLAGLETFNKINVDYETAYQNNPFKKSCISKAISLLPPNSSILDIGCGTGVPVSSMLHSAGLQITGFDISPKMIALAQRRVPSGIFTVSDMLEYTVPGDRKFRGVFMIYSHLQLTYAEFHAAAFKFARVLEPGGIFVIGQSVADAHVGDAKEFDESGTYVEGFDLPFMGEPCATLLLTEEGQRAFLRSMGLEVVWEEVGVFQPGDERCNPEVQQYVIARRPVGGGELTMPKPLPKGRK